MRNPPNVRLFAGCPAPTPALLGGADLQQVYHVWQVVRSCHIPRQVSKDFILTLQCDDVIPHFAYMGRVGQYHLHMHVSHNRGYCRAVYEPRVARVWIWGGMIRFQVARDSDEVVVDGSAVEIGLHSKMIDEDDDGVYYSVSESSDEMDEIGEDGG